MTIESATFQLAAQCPNQLRQSVPPRRYSTTYFTEVIRSQARRKYLNGGKPRWDAEVIPLVKIRHKEEWTKK